MELMITIAILAIVTALAAPSFSESIRRNKRISCTNQLVGTLQLARSEAVRRGQTITVTAPNGIAQGVTVYRDDNADGDADSNEIIQVSGSCNGPDVAVSSGNIEFNYTADGQTTMASSLAIDICDTETTGESGRKVSVLISGVLRSSPFTCS